METPVLFLIFNRPDTTKLVFEAIRQARPTKLFIAGDGPRASRPEEVRLCQEARDIAKLVDWPCEVKTRFLDENLGCGKAVSGAISWFFDAVEEGIIVEDDCLPNQDFFFYCQTMLDRYRHDERIMQIAGTSFLGSSFINKDGHYLSKHGNQWGWATWRRAWGLYDFEIKKFQDSDARIRMRTFLADDGIADYLEGCYKALVEGRVDTWDYQWWFAWKLQGGLSVRSFRNLITNIGHVGAHSHQRSRSHDLEQFSIDRSKIDTCCNDPRVVRAADTVELQFIGLYPKNIMWARVKDKISRICTTVAYAVFGSRAPVFYNYLRVAKRCIKKKEC